MPARFAMSSALSSPRLHVLGVEVLQDPSDSAEVRVPAGQSGHGMTRLAHRAVRDRRFREPSGGSSMRVSSGHFRHSRSRMTTAMLNASLIGVVQLQDQLAEQSTDLRQFVPLLRGARSGRKG